MGRILSIGDIFPEFKKQACISIEPGKEFVEITNEDHKKAEQWMVIFWYPKDFTFVCPTEIAEFNNQSKEFSNNNAMLIGASTDSEFVHLAWRNDHPDLRSLTFPLLADTSKSLAEDLGILEADEKTAFRATFIVDPEGIIRWINVNDIDVGRNVKEVIRVLSALKTGEKTPCDWQPGQATL